MEKIRIGMADQLYDIVSITQVSLRVLKIVFASAVPEEYGDIDVYTSGGIQCAHLPGYDTLYKQENEQTLLLSDDGSVYVEPVAPEPVPDPEPYVPILEEMQTAKKEEINTACSSIIVNGFNATLPSGTLHFTLKEEDQIALLTCAAMVQRGEENIPWHPNGDKTVPCVFYSNADMQIITDAAYFHRSYHQTYCNSLKVWVDNCQTTDEIAAIFYGADVPDQYQSDVLKAYLLKTTVEALEDETEESVS